MSDELVIGSGEPIEFSLGSLRVDVRRREVGKDGGHSVGIQGDVDGESVDLVRFDLFRGDPHYHVPASDPKPKHVDPKQSPAGRSFTLDCFRNKLPDMIREAGGGELAASLESSELAQAARTLEQALNDAPEPTEFKTVTISAEMREKLGL